MHLQRRRIPDPTGTKCAAVDEQNKALAFINALDEPRRTKAILKFAKAGEENLSEASSTDMSETRNKILILLSPTPVAVDEIVRQCQLSPATVALVLLELELAGRLERHPGNQVSIL